MADREAGISGKWLVWLTLSLFVVVPLVTWGALRLAQRNTRAAGVTDPLRWGERSRWEASRVTEGTLERGPMSSARTGKMYFDYPDPVTPEGLGVMLGASRLVGPAASRGTSSPSVGERGVGERLEGMVGEMVGGEAGLFYPRYLLGWWYMRQGEVERADALLTQAFRLAPAALVRRYVRSDGTPVMGYQPPPLRLAFDRVRADHVDSSLTLWYPVLPTDESGRVYVPVFRGVVREVDPRWAEGVPVPGIEADWRVWPGRVGELEERLVQ